jgi:hypothetical protein
MKKLMTGLILSAVLFPAFLGAGEVLTLITPEEAMLADVESIEDKTTFNVGREITLPDTGPVIEVISPKDGGVYKAPLPIELKFIPKEGTEVDPNGLKVEYLKFITIDITDRVKPYADPTGIHVEKADLPLGKHTIRVTIPDSEGGVSSKKLTATIE